MIAVLGRFSALALFVVAPVFILFFRHAPPVLALVLLYFLTVPLFWSSAAWPRYLLTLRRIASSHDVWLAAGFLGYCLASALLSPAGASGVLAAAQMAAGFVIVLTLAAAASHWPDQRLTLCLLVGVTLSSLLLIYDLRTGLSLREAAGLTLRASDANRAAVYGVLAVPIMLDLLARGGSLRLPALAVLPLAAFAAFSSFSSSAALALAAGCAVFTLVHVTGRRGVVALGVVVCLSILLMPWLAGAVHSIAPNALYSLSAKNTMEPRAIIWEGFARLVELRPLLGYGFEASAIADLLPEAAALRPELRQLLAIGHPHNMPLQVWFELGAVGAVWAAVLVWRGFRRIAEADASRMGMLAALACAVYAVSIVSHGAWQVWWPLMIALIIAAAPPPQAAEDAHAG